MAAVPIRPPTAREVPALRRIENAAGEAFRSVGLAAIADDEPPPLVHLEAFRVADRAWVAEGADGAPVAYLVALELDGGVHVEQVSVDPSHARRGIGARLLDHVAAQAPARGWAQMTLTTFRDVPWNAPYYARLGFRILAPEELGPGLAAVVAAEARSLPSQAPRVAMVRAV